MRPTGRSRLPLRTTRNPPGTTTPPTSQAVHAASTSTTSSLRLAASPGNVAERLWDEAYDQIRNEKAVLEYNKLLVTTLGQNALPGARQAQLQELITASSSRLEKTRSRTDKLEKFQWILKLKDIVTGVVSAQANPAASIAWTAVCVAFGFIDNAVDESKSNQEGFSKVVDILERNDKLSMSRLAGEIEGLRAQVEKEYVTLYKKILLYLMTSVYYYHQSGLKTFLKNTIKAYDWTDMLKQVTDAEQAVHAVDGHYKAEQNTANLKTLTDIARSKEDNECLRQLRVTDPRLDKKRIETTGGGLLHDAYDWFLATDQFKNWKTSNHTLWIHGDPGKGKTMLLCGITNELSKINTELAYFFCQATDIRLNSAQSVLRGLLWMMAISRREILAVIKGRFDEAGKDLFQDANAWEALVEIFTNVVEQFPGACFVIDALDECEKGLGNLLDLITNLSTHARWIVSSRNWPEIEQKLSLVQDLSLELNADSVAFGVKEYIAAKVADLAQKKQLSQQTRLALQDHLLSSAEDTYLYVALVCRSLEKSPRGNILAHMRMFPKGLGPVYERMLKVVDPNEWVFTKQILAISALAYRPMKLLEFMALIPCPNEVDDYELYLVDLTSKSGFLCVRDSTISFVHLSAKEYLTDKVSVVNMIFDDGKIGTHRAIWRGSAHAMFKTLRRNPCNLKHIGDDIGAIQIRQADALGSVVYACVFAISHFLATFPQFHGSAIREDVSLMTTFLKEIFMYWLESMILLDEPLWALNSMIQLRALLVGIVKGHPNDENLKNLQKLQQDSLRFLMLCAHCTEHPLQIYANLAFAPHSSSVRQSFGHEIPEWLQQRAQFRNDWRGPLLSFPTHAMYSAMKLSMDKKWLVVLSYDNHLEVRTVSSGHLLYTLRMEFSVRAMDISLDCKHLAVAGSDIIGIWQLASGNLLERISIDDWEVGDRLRLLYIGDWCIKTSLEDFRKSRLLVTYGACIKVWDSSYHQVATWLLPEDLQYQNMLMLMLPTHPCHIAIRSRSHLQLYDLSLKIPVWIIETDYGRQLLISADNGNSLVYTNFEDIVFVNTATGEETLRFHEGNGTYVHALCDAPDQQRIFIGLDSGSINVRDYSGRLIHRIANGNPGIRALFCTADWIICLTYSCLDFWERTAFSIFESNNENAESITADKNSFVRVSPDGKMIAHRVNSRLVNVWNEFGRANEITMDSDIRDLTFSYDSRLAILLVHDPLNDHTQEKTCEIWDLKAQPVQHNSTIPCESVLGVAFSPNLDYIWWRETASVIEGHSADGYFRFDEHSREYYDCLFSSKGILVSAEWVSISSEFVYRVWNFERTESLIFFRTRRLGSDDLYMAFSSNGAVFAILAGGQYVDLFETETWKSIEVAESDSPDLSLCSFAGRCFRYQTRLLADRTKFKIKELVVVETSVYIDDTLILSLPQEFKADRFRTFAIRDNRLIWVLADRSISVLEIDIDRALAPEDQSYQNQEQKLISY